AGGKKTLLLLGSRALRAASTEWAGKIAAATGCGLKAEFYSVRAERGAGRVAVPRLPYAVDAALQQLAPYDTIVLVGAKDPVAFFAYPNKPSKLAPPACNIIELATPADDLEAVLHALAERVDATRIVPTHAQSVPYAVMADAPLDSAGVG